VRDSLIGWAKDDGLDAGSGAGAGTVLVSNCWFESCFHEALARSGGGRVGNTHKSVILNCGQGVEAGFSSTVNSPLVLADGILCLGNAVGARFGDNYPWSYAGFLRVTNSMLLYNRRDVWGMNWQDWSYRASQMDVRGNYLSASNQWHPDNQLWNPSRDGQRLSAFRTGPADNPVGIGFALFQNQSDIDPFPARIPVGLSCFSAKPVRVQYSIEGALGFFIQGILEFPPGQTVSFIQPSLPIPTNQDLIAASLSHPEGAELTGLAQVFFVRPSPPSHRVLRWVRTRQGVALAWGQPGGVLEQAEDPRGPWKTVAGSRSPLVVGFDQAGGFYRLRQ
jgi:hypothetical protein